MCTGDAEDVVRLDWWWTLDTILLRDGIGGGLIVQDWGEVGLSVRGRYFGGKRRGMAVYFIIDWGEALK